MIEHFKEGFMKCAEESEETSSDRLIKNTGKGVLFGAGGIGGLGAVLGGLSGHRAAKILNAFENKKIVSPGVSAMIGTVLGGAGGALSGLLLGGAGGLGVGAVREALRKKEN